MIWFFLCLVSCPSQQSAAGALSIQPYRFINISNEVGHVKRDLIFVSKLDRNVPFFAFWFAFFFLS
jgi:hypothetical protein